jgi:hypothetical protein
MNNLLEMVQSQMSDDVLENLGKNILGGANKETTQAATNGVLSFLTTALSKNASKPEGANALVSALDRDHDGSVLDDVFGLLGGALSPKKTQSANMFNGAGILKHVLGGQQNVVYDMVGRMTGLDKSNIAKLAIALAPMVMGALGKARRQNNLSVKDVSGLLRGSVESEQKKNKSMSVLEKFLDSDGDGSIMDDLAGIGMRMFLKK